MVLSIDMVDRHRRHRNRHRRTCMLMGSSHDCEYTQRSFAA